MQSGLIRTARVLNTKGHDLCQPTSMLEKKGKQGHFPLGEDNAKQSDPCVTTGGFRKQYRRGGWSKGLAWLKVRGAGDGLGGQDFARRELNLKVRETGPR